MAPCKTIRPGMIPLWMLNDASSVAEKIQYMRACRAGGIEALCMHPRSGNLIPYASDEWFRMIRALVAEGRRLDMSMWLYDEDPYPSGAAGGLIMSQRPDLRAWFLSLREKPAALKPGDLWLISETPVEWAGLVPVEKPLAAKDLTAQIGLVRKDWFMGKWDSRYYYADTPIFPAPRGDAVRPFFTLRVPPVPRGFKLAAIVREWAGIEGSWGCLPDLLNPETFELFRALVLDRYAEAVGEHFGKTIPGIFTDEAKPHGWMPFTADMFESFRERYGYDLRPRLHQLFGEPLGFAYIEARLNYRRWVARRFIEAFMRPYRRYCDRHSLHLVGHLSPEDDPVDEGLCLGSVAPLMRLLSLPGTDVIVPFTGNTEAPGMNLGSLRIGSLKSQHARPYAMSETLALCGWGVRTAKARQLFAWQKVLGVDRFFVHGFFNSNEGIQNYEAPPDYGPGSPIFPGMSAFNRWLKRLDAVTDGGAERADVAVLSTMESFYVRAPGMDETRLRRMCRSLWQTILACLRAHVGVHVVSGEDLCEAKVRRGKLIVGRRAYSAVLVPDVDLLSGHVAEKLDMAMRRGVSVNRFAGMRESVPRRLRRTPAGRVLACSAGMPYPSTAWCRKRFAPQVQLSGQGNEDCYVRRFSARDGAEYVLAANVSDRDLALKLRGEKGKAWLPVEADGDAIVRRGATDWRVPALGCGLFRLGVSQAPVRGARTVLRAAGRGRTFERLGVNVLRLEGCTVSIAGRRPVAVDHPRPYWQVSDDYAARRTWPTYLGQLPLESTVPNPDVRYRFVFRAKGAVNAPKLVLDPRCARGKFRVLLNGRAVGGLRSWPLPHTRAARLLLRSLRRGANTLEFRFRAESAMDGLLAPLCIEGDLDVDARRLMLTPPTNRCAERGWQSSGMPQYMGRGRYRWRERLTRRDLDASWTLEADEVVDNAELFVNGRSMGVRAWAPWRWTLSGLREGMNSFALVVSGTAGNKRELGWQNQPQGWIGKARLIGERQ